MRKILITCCAVFAFAAPAVAQSDQDMMDIAAKSFMMAVNICDTYNKLNGIECRVATKPKIELNISLDIDDLLYAQGFCERTQKGFASAIHETPRLMKGIYMNFFYGGKFLMTCPFNPPMNSR